MLVALRIRDLAVIESLELEFEPGFTVLTGETGAGKSIMVDALTLVLGGRASSDLIRTGAESAEVEALLNLADAPSAKEYLVAAGIVAAQPGNFSDQDEIVVRRLITRSGKNRVWINGKLESTGRLFELGRYLVDIYGQHEYQTLLRADRHCSLLDSFGKLSSDLAAYKAAYGKWRQALGEYDALDLDESNKREREEILRYRVREIESAGIEPGEEERLGTEREKLIHADTLKNASAFGVDYLYESDDSMVGGLKDLGTRLREAAVHDPDFSGPADQVDQAAAVLEEVALDLRKFGDRFDADPDRLLWVDDRRAELKRLKRKYGGTEGEVAGTLAEAKAELLMLERQEDRLKELSSEVVELHEKALSLAMKLRRARGKTGAALAKDVELELSNMGMEKTRFEVRQKPRGTGDEELGESGADHVEFYLSTNPGEDVKLLSKIASGGELSRIMLSLRVLLLGEGDVPTMVFDEVDEGIGGGIAEAVGRRMRRLSSSQQVLCVTHLSQIAALAHQHFSVIKHQEKNRTWTEVKTLAREDRIEELGRMMAGIDVTDAARTLARNMLESAGEKSTDKISKGGSGVSGSRGSRGSRG